MISAPMAKSRESISSAEARRVALAAQGFGRPRPARVASGDVLATVRLLGLLQIDSVNVLVRSHYLPLYSRLGAYGPEVLDDAAYGGKRRTIFEYWGHEASLLPVELQPCLRWRMERARQGIGLWSGVAAFGKQHPGVCAAVLDEIRSRGPLGVSDLQAGGKRRGGWWGWSEGKVALEWLFWTGQVSTHSRRRFERIYDVTERVLPARIVKTPTPDAAAAQRELLRVAARALGVATERDLRDYYRLPVADTRARIVELVESGDIQPVAVEGWKHAAYLASGAKVPRHVEACALLSPFDSLVFERNRTERIFDFRYRLELYTPAHKRQHGYYVLPFLLGERIVARLDLKADRARGVLRVVSAHCEPSAAAEAVADPLRAELGRLAGWLQLDRIAVSRRHGFTQALR
jgi:uncharacterized protein